MSFHRSSSYGNLVDPYYTDGDTYKYTFQDDQGYSRSPRMSRSPRRSRSRTRSPRARRNRPNSATTTTRGSQRYRRSTVASACRCRSASPDRLAGRLSSLGLEDQYEVYDDEPKPPFVVRHCDSAKLIGRRPGTVGPNDRRRRSRSAGRRAEQIYGPGSSGYASGGYTSLDDDYVVRGSRTEPLNYSYYSDDDRAGYDDKYVASKYGRRIRATSPVSYRQPLAVRFDTPVTPRYDTITTTVDSALRRNRYTSPTRLHSSYNQDYLDNELEDLKIDLELARTRRLIEEENREHSRMFPGISHAHQHQHHGHQHQHHRDNFNSKLYNSYSDIYGPRTRPFYA